VMSNCIWNMLDGSRFNLMDEGLIAHDDDRQ